MKIKEAKPPKDDQNDGEFLFKYPILEYVEETSKIMLMNEFELVYWYHVLERYLRSFSTDPKAVRRTSAKSVRVLFFFAAMFVKKFLAK